MVGPAKRGATYEDVLNAPPHMVAEIIDGELYLQPRPGTRHSMASTVLGGLLEPPFGRAKGGGPGGWIILDEPEVHLGDRPDIVVPDLGGWRRERMPELPDAAYLTLAPDWVCEVLSPSTEVLDRSKKLAIYAREGVSRVWLLDPFAEMLEVYRLSGEGYLLLGTHAGEASPRVEPFDAIELELSALWMR